MPNDLLSMNSAPKPMKPKASRGLSAFFQPAIDTVAALDPTDTLLQLLSGVKKPAPPTLEEGDYNFVPPTPQFDPIMEEAMNRQGKVKQVLGKIPGR